MRKILTLSILLGSLTPVSAANAAGGSSFVPGDADEASLASFMNFKAPRPRTRDGTLSLVLPSFVVHGTRPDAETAAAMPRKTDASGTTVMTPGVGLQYVSAEGNMLIAAVVKDCYDDLAGTLQVGRSWRLGRDTSWALTAGVYVRETPMACDHTGPGGSLSCENIDSYPVKWLATVNHESVDVIPMPFLHFQTTLYRDRNFRVDFKLMGNIALNEFGFAFPF